MVYIKVCDQNSRKIKKKKSSMVRLENVRKKGVFQSHCGLFFNLKFKNEKDMCRLENTLKIINKKIIFFKNN